MKPTITVAVSGGVDSMMAACLLKEQGHHVIGIHFVTGYESDPVFAPTRAAAEGHSITEIGEQLGISIELLDGRNAFKRQVVDYFMAKAVFPLGGMLKSDVKQIAAQKQLRPVKKSESQDVCFIKDKSYNEFLLEHGNHIPPPGPIVDPTGNVIGRHSGLHQFTIGQRRGVNCPAPEPYYVVRLDPTHNRLVVGSKSDLLTTTCKVTDINWINKAPAKPVTVSTRIRYRHKEVSSKLYLADQHTAEIRFESPMESITPGQEAVFYKDDEVLGGGFICPTP